MSSAASLEERFRQGVDLFNRREFFLCHEVLEEVWKKQDRPERELTQGIIQIAVAYHHVTKGNYAGAIKLMERGIPRLRAFVSGSGFSKLLYFLEDVEQDLLLIKSEKSAELLKIPQLDVST